jgi:pentatricopeptide repeat protein
MLRRPARHPSCPPAFQRASFFQHDTPACLPSLCSECDLALDVYQQLLADGCTPNLVTFNILIDIHGKSGQWARAVEVLDQLQAQVRCGAAAAACWELGLGSVGSIARWCWAVLIPWSLLLGQL